MAVELRGDARYRRGTRLQDVREWCRIAFARVEGPKHPSLTVVLTGDEEIREMNRTYRQVDEPTDVLSFADDGSTPFPEVDPSARYLGDIVISIPRAAEQAEAAGHSLIEEVRLLVVHGLLHLVGYDHVSTGEEVRMWAAQDAILSAIAAQEATR